VSQQFYNDAIIALAKANHGAGRLPQPEVSATCDNPLCGDRVTIDLVTTGGAVRDLAQRTRGCLLTQAAASAIGRHGAGVTPEQVREVTAQLRRLLAGEAVETAWPELAMFAPVSAVKSRHDCVLLPFQALAEALDQVPRR
jgi:nitrogen fixation NifU-like protein